MGGFHQYQMGVCGGFKMGGAWGKREVMETRRYSGPSEVEST